MLELFSRDVFSHILRYLNLRQRAGLFRVSKTVSRKASDPALWYQVTDSVVDFDDEDLDPRIVQEQFSLTPYLLLRRKPFRAATKDLVTFLVRNGLNQHIRSLALAVDDWLFLPALCGDQQQSSGGNSGGLDCIMRLFPRVERLAIIDATAHMNDSKHLSLRLSTPCPHLLILRLGPVGRLGPDLIASIPEHCPNVESLFLDASTGGLYLARGTQSGNSLQSGEWGLSETDKRPLTAVDAIMEAVAALPKLQVLTMGGLTVTAAFAFGGHHGAPTIARWSRELYMEKLVEPICAAHPSLRLVYWEGKMHNFRTSATGTVLQEEMVLEDGHVRVQARTFGKCKLIDHSLTGILESGIFFIRNGKERIF